MEVSLQPTMALLWKDGKAVPWKMIISVLHVPETNADVICYTVYCKQSSVVEQAATSNWASTVSWRLTRKLNIGMFEASAGHAHTPGASFENSHVEVPS